jgi:MFS family permease
VSAADLGVAAERGLLRNRGFLAIWSAQILSMTAANATTSALIVLVAELTKSNTSSSILIMLAIIPAVLFGVVAGVVVDRTDRKRVLIVTNVLRAVVVGIFLFTRETVAVAYLVNFLVAAVTVFFAPAEAAMLPSLVRRRDLLVANSLFTVTFNAAFLVGFIILAPVLIGVAGFEALFAVVALMFVAAALLSLTLPRPEPTPERLDAAVAGEAVAQMRGGVAEALRYLRTAPLVTWALVYIALTYMLVAIAGALAPGFMREVLGLRERDQYLLVGPAGLGVVAGLAGLNAIGQRLGRADAIGLGLALTTLALVGLAGARPLASLFRRVATSAELGQAIPYFVVLVALTAFVFGIAYAFITVPSMTLLQEELRDEIRGRVFGVMNMLVSVFSFLPLVVVGPVADIWGVAPVFLASAVGVSAVWIASRATRRTPLH